MSISIKGSRGVADGQRDSLVAYIRKRGGINYQAEHNKGELRRITIKEAGRRAHGIINKNGNGLTLDRMLECLKEDFFFTEDATTNDLSDALENEMYGGEKLYSQHYVFSKESHREGEMGMTSLPSNKTETSHDGGQTGTTQDTQLGDLIEEIEECLKQFISFEKVEVVTPLACWVIQAHIYKCFSFVGFPHIKSATKRCGKTNLMDYLGAFLPDRPFSTLIPTEATLFRTEGALLLDEMDNLRESDSKWFGLVKAVLCSAFRKNGYVVRMKKDKDGNQVPARFSTFRPIVLAGIEELDDTIADRTFPIVMRRASTRLPRWTRTVEETAAVVRNDLVQWTNDGDNKKTVEESYEKIGDEIAALSIFDSRFQDISEPLYVIAHIADIERGDGSAIRDRLMSGLKIIGAERIDATSGKERTFVELLHIFKEVLNNQPRIFSSTKSILQRCAGSDDLKFLTNAKRLAGFLRPFGLQSTTMTINKVDKKGYRIFADWVDKYLKAYTTGE